MPWNHSDKFSVRRFYLTVLSTLVNYKSASFCNADERAIGTIGNFNVRRFHDTGKASGILISFAFLNAGNMPNSWATFNGGM